MTRSTALLASAAALALALLAAGCGGSSGSSSYGSAGTTTMTSGDATIASASTSLGRVLVNGRHLTVYLFEKDKGKTSSCYGPCASAWPPVTTSGSPRAGSGATAAKLATTRRSDGTLQVTYNGHPLYTYADDSKPGQTNGEGVDEFGAEWYALSPAGTTVEDSGGGSSSSSYSY